MSNHYVWAGGFLALTFGGIGYGAVSGVQASQAASHAPAAPHHASAAEHGEPDHGASGAEPGAPHGAPKGAIDPSEELRQSMRAAIFLGRQGEFAAAAEALEALTHSHPEQASVWLNLGIARLGTRDLEGAEAAFMRTLSIAPADWDAHAELANVALDRGDLDGALVHAHKIPAQKGRMQDRLRNDSRWRAHVGDPRVGELRARHGLDASPAPAEKLQHELELRRQLAAAQTPPEEETPPAAPEATTGARGATTGAPGTAEPPEDAEPTSEAPSAEDEAPSADDEASGVPSDSEAGEPSGSATPEEKTEEVGRPAEPNSSDPSWARRLPTESSPESSVDQARLGVSPRTY
ncbi:MAG: tetratricopeptide repeat protein [Myxococcota bacterium]